VRVPVPDEYESPSATYAGAAACAGAASTVSPAAFGGSFAGLRTTQRATAATTATAAARRIDDRARFRATPT